MGLGRENGIAQGNEMGWGSGTNLAAIESTDMGTVGSEGACAGAEGVWLGRVGLDSTRQPVVTLRLVAAGSSTPGILPIRFVLLG